MGNPAIKHYPASPPDTVRIDLPGDRPVRIVAIADTHGDPHPAAADLVAANSPDLIVHAGDIGDGAILNRFAAIAPLYAVRGNIDRNGVFPDYLILELARRGKPILPLLLTHVALHGPTLRSDVARRARAVGVPLVVCGHSHIPFVGGDRDVAVFNPGSIGPRRFRLPITFGRIDIGETLRVMHIDAETGRRWLPS